MNKYKNLTNNKNDVFIYKFNKHCENMFNMYFSTLLNNFEEQKTDINKFLNFFDLELQFNFNNEIYKNNNTFVYNFNEKNKITFLHFNHSFG